jgi:predicted XRE-type DNA-binding protein
VTAFWTKVNITGAASCWPWKGYKRPNNGYAMFGENGSRTLVHRYAYQLVRGSIPERLMVLHSCDNKSCCNPMHLRVGSIRDNTDDALERGQFYNAARIRAKLSEEEVKYIRKMPLPQDDLAHMFGVTQGTISRIKSGARQGAVK